MHLKHIQGTLKIFDLYSWYFKIFSLYSRYIKNVFDHIMGILDWEKFILILYGSVLNIWFLKYDKIIIARSY